MKIAALLATVLALSTPVAALSEDAAGTIPTFGALSVPGVTDADREQVVNILRGYKLLGPEEGLSTLTTVPLAGPPDAQSQKFQDLLASFSAKVVGVGDGSTVQTSQTNYCAQSCDTLATSATAACGLVPSIIVKLLCIGAVSAGGNYCHSKCPAGG